MTDWTKYTKDAVFNQKREDGTLFLTDFIRDYKAVFKPPEVNTNCLSCLNQYYDRLTKYITKMGTKTPKKCLFKLKANVPFILSVVKIKKIPFYILK